MATQMRTAPSIPKALAILAVAGTFTPALAAEDSSASWTGSPVQWTGAEPIPGVLTGPTGDGSVVVMEARETPTGSGPTFHSDVPDLPPRPVEEGGSGSGRYYTISIDADPAKRHSVNDLVFINDSMIQDVGAFVAHGPANRSSASPQPPPLPSSGNSIPVPASGILVLVAAAGASRRRRQ
jgi:hypothetical protein